jgi:hypothetical protein
MEEKGEHRPIFVDKRCKTCGDKNKKTIALQLYPRQKAFIDTMTKEFDIKSSDVSSNPSQFQRPHWWLQTEQERSIAESREVSARLRGVPQGQGRHLQNRSMPLLLKPPLQAPSPRQPRFAHLSGF